MQEEEIKKENKIIKYGKKIIALTIFLFVFLLVKDNNQNEEAGLNTFLFNAGIYFIFIEILIFLSNHIQKIKIKSIYVNLFLLLTLLGILNYILTKNINILFIILIIILFWAFKEIFPFRTIRLLAALLFIFIPLILFKLLVNMIDMPDGCQKIEDGWKCDYKNNSYEKIKETCEIKGNIFHCEGPCFSHVYCFIPFKDIGKECNNSDQCKGYCEGNMEKISNEYRKTGAYPPGADGKIKCNANDTCNGSCSAIPIEVRGCTFYFEVNDGYYILHYGGWC